MTRDAMIELLDGLEAARPPVVVPIDYIDDNGAHTLAALVRGLPESELERQLDELWGDLIWYRDKDVTDQIANARFVRIGNGPDLIIY